MKTKLTAMAFLCVLLSYGCASTQSRVVDWGKEPETYRRIQVLNNKLLPVMDRENMHKYRYAIIDNNMPQAYAVCEKYELLVYRGALDNFNDDELMYILAHEISHIKSGHCQKRKFASKSEIRRQELDADLEAVKTVQGHFNISATVFLELLEKLKIYTEARSSGRKAGRETHPAFMARIREISQFYYMYINADIKQELIPPYTGHSTAVPLKRGLKALVVDSSADNDASRAR